MKGFYLSLLIIGDGVLQFHTAARVHTESCESSDCEIPFSEVRAQVKGGYSTNDNAHSIIANVEAVQDIVFDNTAAHAVSLATIAGAKNCAIVCVCADTFSSHCC